MREEYLQIEPNWMDVLNIVEFHDRYIQDFLKNNKEEIKDYEAYNNMHSADGTFVKSYGGLSQL